MLIELLDALLEERILDSRAIIAGGHGRLSRKILIALMVSSGALRFGQWPVAVITMS